MIWSCCSCQRWSPSSLNTLFSIHIGTKKAHQNRLFSSSKNKYVQRKRAIPCEHWPDKINTCQYQMTKKTQNRVIFWLRTHEIDDLRVGKSNGSDNAMSYKMYALMLLAGGLSSRNLSCMACHLVTSPARNPALRSVKLFLRQLKGETAHLALTPDLGWTPDTEFRASVSWLQLSPDAWQVRAAAGALLSQRDSCFLHSQCLAQT